MKILYAAGRRKGAEGQSSRILQVLRNEGHTLKLAAYGHNSNPVDWNLETLYDVRSPKTILFEGSSFEIYYEQVKRYSPDLIISDLEIFTSHLATILNIPIIQISPKLLYEGMVNQGKEKSGIHKNYHYFSVFNQPAQYFKNIIDNADGIFAYSHIGDLKNPPKLKERYEFVRPYHVLGQESIVARHESVAISSDNHRGLIYLISSFDDAVLFSDFSGEKFPRIVLKKATDINEYACNLRNCQYFINRGAEEHLADAFYNGKFSYIVPDFEDEEAIISSIINQNLSLAQVIYDPLQGINPRTAPKPHYDCDIRFLHERLHDF